MSSRQMPSSLAAASEERRSKNHVVEPWTTLHLISSRDDGRTMLSIEDVRSIPLFSTLAPAELERLADTSADLHLGAGEFVVPKVEIARSTQS